MPFNILDQGTTAELAGKIEAAQMPTADPEQWAAAKAYVLAELKRAETVAAAAKKDPEPHRIDVSGFVDQAGRVRINIQILPAK